MHVYCYYKHYAVPRGVRFTIKKKKIGKLNILSGKPTVRIVKTFQTFPAGVTNRISSSRCTRKTVGRLFRNVVYTHDFKIIL